MKSQILIAGSGKIGGVIAQLLASTGDYEVFSADLHHTHTPHVENLHWINLDVLNNKETREFFKKKSIQAIVSCLPYFHTTKIAQLAKEQNTHYFDLSEDVNASKKINDIATNAKTAFVSQCGLAPGFIDIVANDLIKKFSEAKIVKLRCGALPQTTSNALQYALTWSIDGLINEYGNPCHALIHGHPVSLAPLEDLEMIQIEGEHYEAFNTSGGIGTLAETYRDKIDSINYKTIRYPGHCEKMHFLMHDLRLNDDRDTLKKILSHAIPQTREDVVVVYVSVHGQQDGGLFREAYAKKFHPTTLAGVKCTAIQATTASSACAVVDIVLQNPKKYHGRVKQEDFNLQQIFKNRFGKWMGDKK